MNETSSSNPDFANYDIYSLLYKGTHQSKFHHKKVDSEDIFKNLQTHNLNVKQVDTLIDEVKEWKLSNEKVIAAELIGVASLIMSILVVTNLMPKWCAWFVVAGITIMLLITVFYDTSRYSAALEALQAYKRFLLTNKEG